MAQIQLIPEPRPDGTVVLRVALRGPSDRLRALLDRLRRR
jgi:hypothetical protein